MSKWEHYRKRNQSICFRMNIEERRELEARIAVSGMPKGEYYRQSLLFQQIEVIGGKYQSDRLSLEVKRLRETLKQVSTTTETEELLTDCKALLTQMIMLMNKEEVCLK